MSVKLSPVFLDTQFDNSGKLANGFLVYTYAAGSTTPQTTYTDATGATPQANPLALNARGEPANPFWLTTGLLYKFVLKDASNNLIRTIDNVSGVNDSTVSTDQWQPGPTPTFVSATQFTLVGDQTSTFAVGRRLKFTTTAGTVYGTITVSAFTTLTTVTMVMDGVQVLDSGLSAVSYGLLSSVNLSIPRFIQAGTGITVSYDSQGRPVINTGGVPLLPMINGTLSATVSANALTIAVKTLAGANPSATDTVYFQFSNQTGGYSSIAVTAALSIVVSSGSTLGTTNAVLARLMALAINDAGTVRLGVYNPLLSGNTIAIYDDTNYTSTAEGGAGGADSAQVIYTGTAVGTPAPVRTLGYVEATEATAGTWATAPSKVQLWLSEMGQPQSSFENYLGADVALNNTGLFFDGPSVAQGSTGTWYASGWVTLIAGSANENFDVKLWDGTTTIGTGRAFISNTAGSAVMCHVSGYLASPAGNLRISAKCNNGTDATIKFNITGNSKDSAIFAYRTQ